MIADLYESCLTAERKNKRSVVLRFGAGRWPGVKDCYPPGLELFKEGSVTLVLFDLQELLSVLKFRVEAGL